MSIPVLCTEVGQSPFINGGSLVARVSCAACVAVRVRLARGRCLAGAALCGGEGQLHGTKLLQLGVIVFVGRVGGVFGVGVTAVRRVVIVDL